ncbi:MAG: leucyl aminopeptidase family protein [Sulfuricella sp.]|nr:leucyl aminopeptidase family protein [Sulfuricella sp.]
MLPKIIQNQSIIDATQMAKCSHLLVVMPATKLVQENIPGQETLAALLARRGMKPAELAKTPVAGDLPHGGMVVWMMLDGEKSSFEQYATLRKALQPLLAEHPKQLAIAVCGDEAQRKNAAENAIRVALLNAGKLPVRKKKDEHKPLKSLVLFGHRAEDDFAGLRALAAGNWLTRELTVLPANELTPTLYRKRIKALAAEYAWEIDEYDMKRLRKLGAGAFVAVAQGSDPEDAAIVHLRYRPKGAKQTVALVGKGICFDTGGHNLKPARYMHGMHEDMNGSAVSLGILLAASQAALPVNLDVWLAIAQNHISPKAYKQNDVVTALNGTSIEIIHTDAEGRMVLADTLTLASRGKPDLLVDFATLTGSMATALGDRYSGIFANREALIGQAVAAGKASGERVNAFPLDADYEDALDSDIADIKQCTMEGEADHILAARFLMRFIGETTPWLHMDLSASRCKGGLGAVGSDVTGFGVAWGVEMLSTTALVEN